MKTIPSEIPDVVIFRLPLYLRILTLLEEEHAEVVSSQELGVRLQMTPAQIRKDLSYFGRFGKQGKGYNVKLLQEELRWILGLNREWRMALIGVGRLGKAVLDYGMLALREFTIVAAFDIDPHQIGRNISGVVIQDLAELADTVKSKSIDICVITVPPSQVQQAIDYSVGCGVKAILNYAPTAARVPKGVRIEEVDPTLALQTMTYYLKSLSST